MNIIYLNKKAAKCSGDAADRDRDILPHAETSLRLESSQYLQGILEFTEISEVTVLVEKSKKKANFPVLAILERRKKCYHAPRLKRVITSNCAVFVAVQFIARIDLNIEALQNDGLEIMTNYWRGEKGSLLSSSTKNIRAWVS